jgi:hypothetical protein
MTINHKASACIFSVLLIVSGVFNSSAPGSARAISSDKKDRSTVAESGTNPEALSVMWKEPDNIESLDLFNGPGGAGDAPDLSGKFTYIKRDAKGTQKKIIVKDDKGGEWIVKYGPEARPETAATRIVWAMGYHADEDYFVKQVHIEGIKEDAVNVRFKRRHNGYKDVGTWTWESNPFVGTRELDGLKVAYARAE